MNCIEHTAIYKCVHEIYIVWPLFQYASRWGMTPSYGARSTPGYAYINSQTSFSLQTPANALGKFQGCISSSIRILNDRTKKGLFLYFTQHHASWNKRVLVSFHLKTKRIQIFLNWSITPFSFTLQTACIAWALVSICKERRSPSGCTTQAMGRFGIVRIRRETSGQSCQFHWEPTRARFW